MTKKVIPFDDVALVPDEAECVFRGKIYDVYHWEQQLYDGSYTTFEMLKRPDTASVIAIVEDEILIVKDEQPGREIKYTFPGGRVDPEDESTQDAAVRELKEETGYEFEHIKLVDIFRNATKIEHYQYTFVAWGKYTKQAPKLDPGEKIEESLVDIDELSRLVRDRKGYFFEHNALKPGMTIEELVDLPEYEGREVDR